MSKKIHRKQDHKHNELVNLVVHNVPAEPSSGAIEAQIYYNSASKKLFYRDNLKFNKIGTISRIYSLLQQLTCSEDGDGDVEISIQIANEISTLDLGIPTAKQVFDYIASLGSGVTSINAGDGISLNRNVGVVIVTNSDRGSSQMIFKNIVVSGYDTIAANSNSSSLRFVAGDGIVIKTNNLTKEVTFERTAGGEIFTDFRYENGAAFGPVGFLSGQLSEIEFQPIPSASDTNSGVVIVGRQSFSGEKIFLGGIILDEEKNSIASIDDNGHVRGLDLSIYPTLQELSFVKGAASNIQDQIDTLNSLEPPPLYRVLGQGRVANENIQFESEFGGISQPALEIQSTNEDFTDNTAKGIGIKTTGVGGTGLIADGKVGIRANGDDVGILLKEVQKSGLIITKNCQAFQMGVSEEEYLDVFETPLMVDADINGAAVGINNYGEDSTNSIGLAVNSKHKGIIVTSEATAGEFIGNKDLRVPDSTDPTSSFITIGVKDFQDLIYRASISVFGDFTGKSFKTEAINTDAVIYTDGEVVLKGLDNADGDNTYSKQLVIKPDGTIGSETKNSPILKKVESFTVFEGITTAGENLFSFLRIPANTFSNGDLVSFKILYNLMASSVYFRVYFNTTNTLTGAVKILDAVPDNNKIEFEGLVITSKLKLFLSRTPVTSLLDQINFNPTLEYYMLVTTEEDFGNLELLSVYQLAIKTN